MGSNLTVANTEPGRSLKPLSRFAEEIGRIPATIWRWRKEGWLRTVNIAGKVYVASDDEADFCRRAQAGEFSKKAVVPRREQQAKECTA
jgi:hypothetical protein